MEEWVSWRSDVLDVCVCGVVRDCWTIVVEANCLNCESVRYGKGGLHELAVEEVSWAIWFCRGNWQRGVELGLGDLGLLNLGRSGLLGGGSVSMCCVCGDVDGVFVVLQVIVGRCCGGEFCELWRCERHGRVVCMELFAENQRSPGRVLCCGLWEIERERGRIREGVQEVECEGF